MGVGTFSDKEYFSNVFILDDLSPLGVSFPNDLVDCFSEKKEIGVLDAGKLAKDLCSIIEGFKDPIVLSGGGVLTYTLMKRAGYDANPKFIDIRRDYIFRDDSKRADIFFSVDGNICEGGNYIDDIIASAATINQFGSGLNVASLILSSQARGKYREKQGSTVKNVDTLFAAQKINCKTGFPAIFSARYLVGKAEEKSYLNYVSKYADLDRLLPIVKKINKEPLELLYDNPDKFIEVYGK